LLSLGTLGLTIELWSPGAVLPGVVGGLCLLLAFFAFSILPVNYAGLLLILFGLLLLALEMQLSPGIVVPVVLGFAGIAMFLIRLGLAAQRQPAVTGAAGMIGESGQALTAIAPGSPGRVATHGEIWQAKAAEAIPEGARVRVTDVDGLMLTVRMD
jgi:membrane-bound serine protease (ClpP class)